jgi:uncharacterized membrane protein
MSVLSPAMTADRNSRLLLVSLALNLFFVGAAGALAVRHYLAPPAATPVTLDRSVAARIDRLAATLPASDGDILRAEFRARSAPVEAAQRTYRQAQDRMRQALRAEPFEVEPLRAAMAETRAARPGFDQALQELIAAAAAKMSAAGRNKLADWPPRSRSGSEASR